MPIFPLTCTSINDCFVLKSRPSHLQVPLSEKPITAHISRPSYEADYTGPSDYYLRKKSSFNQRGILPPFTK